MFLEVKNTQKISKIEFSTLVYTTIIFPRMPVIITKLYYRNSAYITSHFSTHYTVLKSYPQFYPHQKFVENVENSYYLISKHAILCGKFGIFIFSYKMYVDFYIMFSRKQKVSIYE